MNDVDQNHQIGITQNQRSKKYNREEEIEEERKKGESMTNLRDKSINKFYSGNPFKNRYFKVETLKQCQ